MRLVGWLLVVVGLLLAGAALVAAVDGGCGVGEEGVRALEAEGFRDIVIGDHTWWKCGRDDSFASNFIATNPLGRRVAGAVCCGWAKGCTVRF